MRIIAGSMRGKIIPFDNRKFGNADVTADRLKESVFSILGNDLSGHSFLDLYSCSGQIGLEAMSRGCCQVVFNEIDRQRYLFIRSQVEAIGKGHEFPVYNLDAERCVEKLASGKRQFDYVYLDPPYVKVRDEVAEYRDIVETIIKRNIISYRGLIIIQHYIRNIFPPYIREYKLTDSRRYGRNGLVFYRRQTTEQ